MAYSSGVFSLFSPGNPTITGTTIQSSWANNTLTDIATGLSTCMLKDGTQTITANIPMSGFKLTNLAAATTAGDALRYEQLFTASTIALLGPMNVTAATGLTATGTIQGDALEVTSTVNSFGTVAANTGAKLISTATTGQLIVIYNGGANPLKIYPQVGATINSLAANASMTLSIKTSCQFWATSAASWVAVLSA